MSTNKLSTSNLRAIVERISEVNKLKLEDVIADLMNQELLPKNYSENSKSSSVSLKTVKGEKCNANTTTGNQCNKDRLIDEELCSQHLKIKNEGKSTKKKAERKTDPNVQCSSNVGQGENERQCKNHAQKESDKCRVHQVQSN